MGKENVSDNERIAIRSLLRDEKSPDPVISIHSGGTVERSSSVSIDTGSPRIELQTFLLVCGILSSLLYVAMNVIVPIQSERYNWISQTVSELSAIDAPTRSLWMALAIPYGVLFVAFGFGVWVATPRNRVLQIAAGMMIAQGILGFFWPPMHQREVLAAGGGTLTDTLHIVFTAVTVPLMLLAMGFGAAALGKRFRIYSIVSIAILVVMGILTGLDAAAMSANLSTPMIGVWERINIAAFMVWVIVFAIALLRRESKMRPWT